MEYKSATIQDAIDALKNKGKAWMIVPISTGTTIEELAGSDGVIVEASSEEITERIQIDHDRILLLSNSGMSVKEIAKETGYKYGTVYSYLRGRSQDPKGVVDGGKIKALYLAGRSPQWIATDMQLQLPDVQKILREQGLIKEDEE